MGNTSKNIKFIVQWLKDYASKTATKGFTLGISGGVDSAVVSTLCAMTGLDVLCVEMPIHQNQAHVFRAKKHIKFLRTNFPNVRSVEADLTKTFDVFESPDTLTGVENMDIEKVNFNLANARARLRMTTLYFYASMNDLLVAGTGNKIEDFGIGFFTKYGDGGVDLSPIGDLMKSEVYAMGHSLGISKLILKAVPTDGLFGDERTDEMQIGASYDELEWAMNYTRYGLKAHMDNSITQRQWKVLEIYNTRHFGNYHKMVMPPVCLLSGDMYDKFII